MTIRVHAGGRLNLIGEHTDYTDGLCLPMAIGRGTTIEAEPGGAVVRLRSDAQDHDVVVSLDDPDAPIDGWGRYVAGVVAEMRPSQGAVGTVTSDLPIGAGLSSSASLQIAVALTLGFDGDATELARLCQRAEQRASGVPCGVMDQMAIAHGVRGSALLLDCRDLSVEQVEIPDGMDIVVVPSGQERELASSAYAQRRDECARAEAEIGPLRDADLDDVARLDDPVLRRRARHVVSENGRVLDVVGALRSGRFDVAGAVLSSGHASLRDDFEVTTPAVDRTVDAVSAVSGVHGARMVGGGFGGVIVAVCEAGTDLSHLGGFRVRPAGAPTVA